MFKVVEVEFKGTREIFTVPNDEGYTEAPSSWRDFEGVTVTGKTK